MPNNRERQHNTEGKQQINHNNYHAKLNIINNHKIGNTELK